MLRSPAVRPIKARPRAAPVASNRQPCGPARFSHAGDSADCSREGKGREDGLQVVGAELSLGRGFATQHGLGD